jgi:hypothetical protein
MADNINITGLNDALTLLEEYPNKINTAVKSAMRKSVAPVIRDIKGRIPKSSWKKSVKYKFVKAKYPDMIFGIFNSEGLPKKGSIPVWFKLYWSNYGTLTRRYSGHSFSSQIKNISRSKKGGISSRLFFDKAIAGKDGSMISSFESNLMAEVDKIVNK